MTRLEMKNSFNTEKQKISALSSEKIDKYEYLTGEEILSFNQRQIIERATFTWSPLEKAFEKHAKTNRCYCKWKRKTRYFNQQRWS